MSDETCAARSLARQLYETKIFVVLRFRVYEQLATCCRAFHCIIGSSKRLSRRSNRVRIGGRGEECNRRVDIKNLNTFSFTRFALGNVFQRARLS